MAGCLEQLQLRRDSSLGCTCQSSFSGECYRSVVLARCQSRSAKRQKGTGALRCSPVLAAATSAPDTQGSYLDQPHFGSVPAPSANSQPEADILVEMRNVHKAFGEKKVLRGCNITIRRGEAVGIIGSSGSGKSTTLRLMAGLVAPDWGEVRICGQVRKGVLGDDPHISDLLQVGMVFQNGALFDSLTVGENVGFLLYEHTDLAPERIQALTAGCLEAVGLSGVEDLQPAQLSGGMRKRVALARAIIRDDTHPALNQMIMYDEPTAGLDPVASTVVEDLIRSLHTPPSADSASSSSTSSSNGTADADADADQSIGEVPQQAQQGGVASYIVVTHQHSTIRRAVDRLIFLHEGKVVWEGPAEEFNTTDVPIVKQFRTGSLSGPISFD
ncbi:hypothetical protein WJX73_007062 [Symbiochloris irregularis]|uniref:ABC transporter domain-containing protein n=1 Tax=Symbiochloris irregularis TaxID=706552 RepID=A0AAW1PN68_9CHLO